MNRLGGPMLGLASVLLMKQQSIVLDHVNLIWVNNQLLKWTTRWNFQVELGLTKVRNLEWVHKTKNILLHEVEVCGNHKEALQKLPSSTPILKDGNHKYFESLDQALKIESCQEWNLFKPIKSSWNILQYSHVTFST